MLLLAFQFDNLGFGILHETFVRQLRHHTAQEALLVLQVCLQFAELLFHIDELIQWHSIFGRTDNEFRGVTGNSSLRLNAYVRQFVNQLAQRHGADEGQLFLGGNVLGCTYVAYAGDYLFHLLHLLQEGTFRVASQELIGIPVGGVGCHDGSTFFALGQVMPQLLRDKRHEGVQQTQHALKEYQGALVRHPTDGLAVGGFDHLQVPTAELVGKEFVYLHQGFRETVFVH